MESPNPISLSSTIVRKPGLLVSGLDDEVVMLSIERGKYYGTEAVGSRIFNLIEKQIAVSTICSTLEEEFEIDNQTCEAEVLAFLAKLQQEDLIQVINTNVVQ